MMHLPIRVGTTAPNVLAPEHPARPAQAGGAGAQPRHEALGHGFRLDAPGSPITRAAVQTDVVALQAFTQADWTWTDAFSHGPAGCGDGTEPPHLAGVLLDPSARKEVERMLGEAKGYAAAIERSRRQLQSTLNMVLDLVRIESARPGPAGHVSPS